MSDARSRAPGRARTADRFALLAGAFVFVVGAVLLVTSDNAKSVTSGLTSLTLGVALLLIAPCRSRRWVKVVGIAACLVAIALGVYGFLTA